MNTSVRKQLSLAIASALVLGFAAGAVQAQQLSPNSDREVWMENGRTSIWKNAYGECWHSLYGPPPGYNECNPAPVAQYVPPPAPPAPVIRAPVAPVQYVAPAPAPAPVVAPPVIERPARKDRG
jgi:hypothetical protein